MGGRGQRGVLFVAPRLLVARAAARARRTAGVVPLVSVHKAGDEFDRVLCVLDLHPIPADTCARVARNVTEQRSLCDAGNQDLSARIGCKQRQPAWAQL